MTGGRGGVLEVRDAFAGAGILRAAGSGRPGSRTGRECRRPVCGGFAQELRENAACGTWRPACLFSGSMPIKREMQTPHTSTFHRTAGGW